VNTPIAQSSPAAHRQAVATRQIVDELARLLTRSDPDELEPTDDDTVGAVLVCAAALWCVPFALRGQTPADTTKPYPCHRLTVSVTRAELPLSKVPLSVHKRRSSAISAPSDLGTGRASECAGRVRRESLQFSRISASPFAASGPAGVRRARDKDSRRRNPADPFPDGQGQLTNLELGRVDRSRCCAARPRRCRERVRRRDQHLDRSRDCRGCMRTHDLSPGGSASDRGAPGTSGRRRTAVPVGGGSASLTVSRARLRGRARPQRCDQRVLNARLRLPLADAGRSRW